MDGVAAPPSTVAGAVWVLFFPVGIGLVYAGAQTLSNTPELISRLKEQVRPATRLVLVCGWLEGQGAIDISPLVSRLLHLPCMSPPHILSLRVFLWLLTRVVVPLPPLATRRAPPQSAAGKWIGAICASPPVVLAAHGLLPPTATWYPSVGDTLGDTKRGATRVVVDDGARVVTSQGPATAIEFGLALAGAVGVDAKVVTSVREQLLVDV